MTLYIADAVELEPQGTDVYCPHCAEVLAQGFHWNKNIEGVFFECKVESVELVESKCGKCSKIWLLVKVYYAGQSTPGMITAILLNSVEP